MNKLPERYAKLVVLGVLSVLVGWPLVATTIEAADVPRRLSIGLAAMGLTRWAKIVQQTEAREPEPTTSHVIDPVTTEPLLSRSRGITRTVRLALETLRFVLLTEAIVLPPGILLSLLLFRTNVPGRGLLIALLGIAAFVPLPLHATAWLGAFGNAGRTQAIGFGPILVGRTGAAVVSALAALPWVVLLCGVGLRTVEPELEEAAALDLPTARVCASVTLRRSLGAIAATALAVAVLTAGDMTVTDLLQVRTYAEEAYVQFTLGRGPADAAVVSIPPLLVLGAAIMVVAGAILHVDPARLALAFSRAKLWRLGRLRLPLGAVLIFLVGNLAALPLYSLIWRAGRVGDRARLGQPPVWSLSGLTGTLRFAAFESREPIQTSTILAAAAATVAVPLAWSLAWFSRRSRFWQVLVLALLALTSATPGPVAGMALELAYRRLPVLYDSPMILVMAQAIRTLPYAILVLWPVLRTLPPELLESAALDGHGPCAVIWHVVIPLSWRALLAAWFVVFVLAFGELPATSLLQPPGTTTITFLIWSLLHTGVESHLAGVALVMLLAITVAAVCAIAIVKMAVRGGHALSEASLARSHR